MKVIPRPQDNGYDAHQFTVENRAFIVRWTDGIFHDDADPRDWELTVHGGNGVAIKARLGSWIVRKVIGFEVLSCDEFDRKYERLDRPGNVTPANPKPAAV